MPIKTAQLTVIYVLTSVLILALFCFSNKEDQQKSIFIKSERGGFKLKENVQFHLYISTSPCGDARIFSPHEAAQEGMTAVPLKQGILKYSLSMYKWHS